MSIKFGKHLIDNFAEPYIVAEIGSNHNGSTKLAKKLIDLAVKCGANCVKFQSWSAKSIFSEKTYEDNYFLNDDYRNRKDHTLKSIVNKYSLSENQLLLLKDYCRQVKIDFNSTPFSKPEVDFLTDRLKVKFIKIASMDVNNYPFLKYIAAKNLPIILSTGLSELHEIDKAIQTIENQGNKKIIILHCISNYPPRDDEINLNNIDSLRSIYPEIPIGFSDHTLGFEVPLAAVAKGACIIEKHFTLDKTMEGWDHKISADPGELKIIVEGARKINKALGTTRIQVFENKAKIRAFRRSIVTTRFIKKGEVINLQDIDFKRPATGVAPEYLEYILGRKAKMNLEADKPIMLKHLE